MKIEKCPFCGGEAVTQGARTVAIIALSVLRQIGEKSWK